MKSSPAIARLLIFAIVCIDLLGFAIVLPLLPRYAEYFSADGLQVGLLFASFSLMQFLFAPLWGRLSDQIGRRPVLLVGLVGSVVFYGLFGYASTLDRDALLFGLSPLTWLFLTRLGQGVAGATISTAQAYIADTTDKKSRSKGMALVGAAFGIGFTFGPLIGAAFVTDDPLAPPGPMPGYLAAGISFIALLVAIFALPESLKRDQESKRHRLMDWGSLRSALGKPHVGWILLAIFLTTLSFAQFESTLSRLTDAMGIEERSNFYVFAYIGLVLAISQGGLVRPLLPRLGELRMFVAGLLMMSLGFVLIAIAGADASEGYLWSVLPVCVVGFAATTPSIQALLSLSTDPNDQGGLLGWGQSFSSLARIVGPVIGNVLFTPENAGLTYFVSAGLMGLALCLAWPLRHLNRLSQDETAE